MPVPAEYQRIYDHLYDFFKDVRDIAGIETTHRAYTTIQGVFQTFRRRLEIKEAISFSNILPAGIRALFAAEWDTNEPKLPFSSRKEMTLEVQSLRKEHNFAPDSAISDVGRALRKNVDNQLLDEVLNRLSADARNFWNPEYTD